MNAEEIASELLSTAEEIIADCSGGNDLEDRVGFETTANLVVAALLGVFERHETENPEFLETIRQSCRQRLGWLGPSLTQMVSDVYSDSLEGYRD